jgi:hypothetical protein
MPVLMVFETSNELLCSSLEIASCAYMCFVLWHVNIYNNAMFGMFYVICLCAVCGTNFDAPSVHMACKDKRIEIFQSTQMCYAINS